MKIQVYLDGVVGDRLVVLAGSERRSVSAMAALLIERGLGLGSGPSRGAVIREATGRVVVEEPVVVEPSPRVPPETPPEPRAEVVERIQQQIPGVKTASVAFPSTANDLGGPPKPKPRGGV